MHIIDVGHTAVMLPLAGAMAVWLMLGRAWKLALWWCLVFTTGLGLVALTKIVFLGWGVELQPIGFKALSGHAWRVTALMPTLFYLALYRARPEQRLAGVRFGLALGMGLGALLVMFGYHTVSEVMGSLVLACVAVAVFLRIARSAPAPRGNRWAMPASIAAVALFVALEPASISPRLVDVALYFSGRDHPYRWSTTPRRLAPPAIAPRGLVAECRVRAVP